MWKPPSDSKSDDCSLCDGLQRWKSVLDNPQETLQFGRNDIVCRSTARVRKNCQKRGPGIISSK